MAEFDFDLFVIGAGSGGVRASRIAASHGARVAVAEEFRIGGTCVIRGCVPKKLLVYASHFAHSLHDAPTYGWTIEGKSFDWAALRDFVARPAIVGSLEEALTGCNFSVALSARLREFSPPVYEPRALATRLADDLTANDNMHAALVFGNERFGLSNEQVEKCSALVSVPANPAYSSLNLSQAVQVLAYECRMAALGDKPETGAAAAIGFKGELASAEQVEGMFRHLEQALVEIEFLDPDNPRKLMPRLRRMFSRTQLETEEVNILRGIATQLIERRQKIRK